MNIKKEIPEIELYSDGGAVPNPGRGGYGVILCHKGRKKEFLQGYKMTTNNRMELTGVIVGLQKLKTKSKVNVFTDSKYTINGIEKGWAEKWKQNNWFRTKSEKAINYDLWEILLELVKKHEVKFNWVKGHNGHIENERCDELATIALDSDDLIEDKNYEPKEIIKQEKTKEITNQEAIIKVLNKGVDKKIKIKKEGDSCRKCGTSVEKKIPKHTKKTQKQAYYYAYYLHCPNCKTMYMVDEAKRSIDTLGLIE